MTPVRPKTELAGWIAARAGLTEENTPKGVLARRGALRGRCDSKECSRHVRVDLGWWVEHGFGDLDLRLILQSYQCARLDCRLKFEPVQYAGGVPLQCYAGDATVKVAVECRCGARQVFPIAGFIERITRAGTGDGNTSILNLSGRLIRGTCRTCGKRDWRVSFERPPVGPGGLVKAGK